MHDCSRDRVSRKGAELSKHINISLRPGMVDNGMYFADFIQKDRHGKMYSKRSGWT